MAILIKRYANRKLYNTETSRYITLKGIAKLLNEGEEVRVIDKETGEDITQVALSQILVDNQRAKEDPSDTLLTQILSRGGDALYGAIKKSVDDASDGIGDFQDRFRSFVNQSESIARGGAGFGWDPRRDGERRSPFSSSGRSGKSTGDATGTDSEHTQTDDTPDTTREAEKSGRGAGWPKLTGLPDIREGINAAVAHALKVNDLPRNQDIEALNRNLTRVAEAIERLESTLRERETEEN
jgi:polyhydroxyalkanoate synthesis repressor PhaR